jgi:hypothetical protein
MKKFLQLVLICCIWLPSVSFSQTSASSDKRNELKQFCIYNINQRTAAMVAEDWKRLIQESDEYIRKCERIWGADELANAYETRVVALNSLDQPTQSLQSVETCLSVDYNNTGCHLGSAEALILLKRFPESIRVLDRTDKLIAFNIQSLESELQRQQNPLDKELSEARRRAKQAHQNKSASLRKWAIEMQKRTAFQQ